MPHRQTYTVGAVANILSTGDEDDNDICPVCDGECTCGPSTSSGPARPAAFIHASSTSSPLVPGFKSLKIKLTVPPNLLAKNTAVTSSSPSVNRPRGRPPKSTKNTSTANSAFSPSPPQKRKDVRPKTKPTKAPLKGKGTTVKKASTTVKRRARSISEDEFSDHHFSATDDARSIQFPTFVSASALSSELSENDSDSSPLSGFGSDSSLEAEEESFILSEERRAHEKSRVRRELLGDEVPLKRNNWIIRPRKKSVGLSDVEMDVDTDATEDDEEEDEEEDDDDETEDEEMDGQRPGAGYAGVATSWSEDDGSSFDADLFFANLSDSSDDSSSVDAVDDGYQTDVEVTSPIPPAFEVSQGWDGQIVFTNDLREGRGILDFDFEANAAQLVVDDSASSQADDVEMQSSEDGEYEEEDEVDLDESDGETTEEELVGEDGLPTQRAMMLFRWPMSVSAINPLSTVSPAVSPGPRYQRKFASVTQDSPKPADILAGRIYWDDSDEHDQPDPPIVRAVRSAIKGVPLMGQFETIECNPQRRAVIDGTAKEIPSPYPRRDRNRSLSISTQLQSEDLMSPISPSLPPTEPIDLDDVLDSSILDTDSIEPHPCDVSSEAEPPHHFQNLDRWDRIPMGTFRRTRESITITGNESTKSSSVPGSTKGALKSSPFSTMLYKKGSRSKPRSGSVIISPVLLPVRDGDRTPTNGQLPPLNNNSSGGSQKTRKELRRERKLKRKSYSTVPHPHPHHQPYQHHHHFHHHYPNSKWRSTSSMQRTNFFGPAISVPPPLNL